MTMGRFRKRRKDFENSASSCFSCSNNALFTPSSSSGSTSRTLLARGSGGGPVYSQPVLGSVLGPCTITTSFLACLARQTKAW